MHIYPSLSIFISALFTAIDLHRSSLRYHPVLAAFTILDLCLRSLHRCLPDSILSWLFFSSAYSLFTAIQLHLCYLNILHLYIFSLCYHSPSSLFPSPTLALFTYWNLRHGTSQILSSTASCPPEIESRSPVSVHTEIQDHGIPKKANNTTAILRDQADRIKKLSSEMVGRAIFISQAAQEGIDHFSQQGDGKSKQALSGIFEYV